MRSATQPGAEQASPTEAGKTGEWNRVAAIHMGAKETVVSERAKGQPPPAAVTRLQCQWGVTFLKDVGNLHLDLSQVLNIGTWLETFK